MLVHSEHFSGNDKIYTQHDCMMPAVRRSSRCDTCAGQWCGHGEKCSSCGRIVPDYDLRGLNSERCKHCNG